LTEVATADGRTLAVQELGDPNGLAVFVHHGTPGSGLLYERWATPGIRLISYDRPGYGESTRNHGRTVGSAATDVDTIADAFGLERFASWGISGGGPHALACAALCDRLTACATLAGVGPWDAEGLDWLEGMGDENIREFDLVLAGEEALTPAVERDRSGLLQTTPETLRNGFETLLGAADRAALTGQLANFLHAQLSRGVKESGIGWVDDDLAFVHEPWGFDVTEMTKPVLVVQGFDDRFVPKQHGEWLAANVAGAEARLEPAEGHLTLMETYVPTVHEWLLAHG
jgi:pimeloyl-ACP methyl ester carboxylesterase